MEASNYSEGIVYSANCTCYVHYDRVSWPSLRSKVIAIFEKLLSPFFRYLCYTKEVSPLSVSYSMNSISVSCKLWYTFSSRAEERFRPEGTEGNIGMIGILMLLMFLAAAFPLV